MKNKVVILILNYNGLESLGSVLFQSIESALRVNYDNFDVAVVDNGSTDGSAEEIANRFGRDVALIKLGKNYGYAGGNEFGFRKYVELKGFPEYVVVMNNDYIVKNRDFLKVALKYMESRKDVVIAQGVNLQANGRRIESAGFFRDVMLYGAGRCNELKLSECPEKPSYVSFVSGCLMIIKIKPVIGTRGCLFKKEFFMLWEDVELALNMWSHGLKTVAIPEVVGIHMSSATVKKVAPLAWYTYTRNKLLVYKGALDPYIRSRYFYTAILFEISLLLLRMRQGVKGKIATRGFADAIFAKEITKVSKGPYEPLIIAPKTWMGILSYLPAPLKRVEYFEKLATLTVNDEMLKNCFRPFIIKVGM